MRFASLGSGSRGNALLVERGETRLLIDNGFSLRELEARLARVGREAGQLSAVLVTHEHNDHIGGIGPLARKYRLPVYMTHGTRTASVADALPRLELISSHEPFAIGELEVMPYPVPHDAREPCQFVFADGARRLGLLTDSGRITQHIVDQLGRCDALVLECNHDAQMLADGPYPSFLKARVGGGLGHLSNAQAAELLERLDVSALQHIVAAHISEKNNTPALARAALGTVLGCDEAWVACAEQEGGLDWRELA